MPGTLYIVATPIGNLEDISQRALRVLREVSLIACEDTRHTRKLLSHYGISTPTISYHDHNERERAPKLLRTLEQGKDVAVVSDAGTPGISDPGFRVVRLALDQGFRVEPVPGASALISALVVSGFPTDQFFFGGFLPSRANQRRTRLAAIAAIPSTLIFYESPHRLGATLRDAREVLGEREAAVARELTKLHEEVVRGRLSELAERFGAKDQVRGEVVLIIDSYVIETSEKTSSSQELGKLVAQFEEQGLNSRAALKKAARELGISRDEAYRQLARKI